MKHIGMEVIDFITKKNRCIVLIIYVAMVLETKKKVSLLHSLMLQGGVEEVNNDVAPSIKVDSYQTSCDA